MNPLRHTYTLIALIFSMVLSGCYTTRQVTPASDALYSPVNSEGNQCKNECDGTYQTCGGYPVCVEKRDTCYAQCAEHHGGEQKDQQREVTKTELDKRKTALASALAVLGIIILVLI